MREEIKAYALDPTANRISTHAQNILRSVKVTCQRKAGFGYLTFCGRQEGAVHVGNPEYVIKISYF